MRLHVGELAALGPHDAVERADLVQHVRVDGFGVALHLGAAEVLAVREARVGANRHVVGDRPFHGLEHGGGVSGVPAARHVGGADQRQQGFVVAATFTQVGIQVDLHGVLLVAVGPASYATKRVVVRRRAAIFMPSPCHCSAWSICRR